MKKTEKRWCVLYTKPRFEKKVNLELSKMGIESFLPLRVVIRKWSDRKKKVEIPIFTSYVFIHVNEKERFLSLELTGVINCVRFNNRLAIIRNEEIENIKKLLSYGKLPDVEPTIVIGSLVRVIKGVLSGMKGILTEMRGKKRFAICINEISRSISIEIPVDEIEVIPNDKKSY